jgi:DNA-binding transcriptional regulator YhcF (GntR family)
MKKAGEPPFRRIMRDIEQRIAAGELAPGDRVPSTRAIAKSFGVALATASHALSALTHAGVLESRPRVGTVVAPARAQAAPKAREAALSRAAIVEAAVAIADTEGLAAVSLRGVAAKLGAPVMSLYRHVPSKHELEQAMVEAVLGEALLPVRVPKGWRAQLEVAAHTQWGGLRKHPWVARLMSLTRPSPTPNALAHADWVLRALDGHGLSAAARLQMHIVLHVFIQGITVNLETEADAIGQTGMTEDDWMAQHAGAFDALAASGRYPAFAGVLRDLSAGFELEMDRVFELGLAALLDGFAQVIESKRKR